MSCTTQPDVYIDCTFPPDRCNVDMLKKITFNTGLNGHCSSWEMQPLRKTCSSNVMLNYICIYQCLRSFKTYFHLFLQVPSRCSVLFVLINNMKLPFRIVASEAKCSSSVSLHFTEREDFWSTKVEFWKLGLYGPLNLLLF